MTDPDLTLRVLADSNSTLATLLDFLKTIGATLVGGLLAFFTARLSDRARAGEERRTLAAAAGAELQASIESSGGATAAARELDPEHNKDTVDYGELPADPTPLVRAAYEKAGTFPPNVATALARFMMLQRQFRQQIGVLKTMREKNLLTNEKEIGRRAAAMQLAVELIDSLHILTARLEEYAQHRPWWRRRRT